MPVPVSFFVSHGSPMLALDVGAIASGWRAMTERIPKPTAIVVASAHWLTRNPTVSTNARPPTIHDFGGFPERLYEIRYEPPGAVSAAHEVAAALSAAGLKVCIDPARGLDHGSWVPLRHMFPDAAVAVCQVSIQPHESTAYHFELGCALADLTRRGVLVIGSGGMTHNLRDTSALGDDKSTPDAYVASFSAWMRERLIEGDVESLLDYRRLAPFAQRAHPSEEHLLPLFVAMGAAGIKSPPKLMLTGVEGAALSIDAYSFEM